MKRMPLRINWVGLAGGVATMMLVAVSLFYPWWQLRVGDGLVMANVSPLNTSFRVLGTSFTMPLVWAMNIASMLTFLVSGITMIIYSLLPAKSYSKTLLGFAYKKPLYTLLTFVIFLFASTLAVQMLLHFSVPLVGSTNNAFPIPLIKGTTISVFISAEFQWPFWLAIVAAGLCIAARFYHKRVVSVQKQVVTLEVVIPTAPLATAVLQKQLTDKSD
jgi:hypothetical protein